MSGPVCQKGIPPVRNEKAQSTPMQQSHTPLAPSTHQHLQPRSRSHIHSMSVPRTSSRSIPRTLFCSRPRTLVPVSAPYERHRKATMSKKNRRNRNATPADRPAKKKRVVIPFVERPFEGLPHEPELVAMREILPLATLSVRTTEEYGAQEAILTTILPGMSGALRRKDGVLLIALQTITSSGDPSLDIADHLINGLDLNPGQALQISDLPEPGPRLQDVLDLESFGEMELHDEPSFWMSEDELTDPENQQALQAAREQLIPTKKVDGVEGAYWCRMSREFVRYVRPESRDAVLDGLARLRAAEECSFDESRFVGAFRAQGLLIPVWELPRGAEADELSKPMAAFSEKLAEAIASTEPLSYEEKRARAGITSRQVTLR